MEKSHSNILISLEKGSSVFNLVLSEKVYRKIREWCMMCPNNEWSGALFYSVEGKFSDGSLKITAVDFYVMDIGSSAKTTYNFDPEIVTYQDLNDLLDCHIGLIHSHDVLEVFFSKDDNDTLIEQAMQMPHFLSLIVNNAGDTMARITRRVKIAKAIIEYPTFGGHRESEEDKSEYEEYVEYFELKVTSESEDTLMKEEHDRYKEIKAKKPVTPSLFNESFRLYDDVGKAGMPTVTDITPLLNKPEVKKNKPSDDTPVLIDAHGIVRDSHQIFIQFLTGSITAGYNPKFNVEQWVVNYMEKAYSRRFPTMIDFDGWVQHYIDYLFNWEFTEDGKILALAEEVLGELEKISVKNSNLYLKELIDLLSEFIEGLL